jgi:predicted dehydrogenase
VGETALSPLRTTTRGEDMTSLRVGIIGTGWGTLVHGPAFQLVPEYELAAICARNPEKVDRSAAKLDVEGTTQSWESFVQRPDLDVISIASPAALHHPMTIAALNAGKHVLCEKPLAITAAQAEEMVTAAEQSGLATACCFELRWGPERLPIWDFVRDGRLGTPYFSRLVQSGSMWHPTHKPQSAWMYDLKAGGGYLAGMLSHDIDWICAMFGDPVAVCADVRTTIPTVTLADGTEVQVTADDTTILILRLTNGMSAEVSCSVVGAGVPATFTFEAFGADGTATLTGGLPDPDIRFAVAGDESLTPWPGPERLPRTNPELPPSRSRNMILGMALMLEDWPNATFRDGWRAQAVIDAARASSAGAGWVQLPAFS